jgi:hypothetical protein
MVHILSLETSTSVCSVAVHADGSLIALSELTQPGAHAERLVLLVEKVLDKAKIGFHAIDAIAVSEGPGSYTGLRIGVSTAKGLAFGLDKPLIAVNTLQALASALELKEGELVIPVLDARRMEVFREVFDWKRKYCRKSPFRTFWQITWFTFWAMQSIRSPRSLSMSMLSLSLIYLFQHNTSVCWRLRNIRKVYLQTWLISSQTISRSLKPCILKRTHC